ncbi:hypothetical protein SK128_001706, partial [Halocaridina rubra]
ANQIFNPDDLGGSLKGAINIPLIFPENSTKYWDNMTSKSLQTSTVILGNDTLARNKTETEDVSWQEYEIQNKEVSEEKDSSWRDETREEEAMRQKNLAKRDYKIEKTNEKPIGQTAHLKYELESEYDARRGNSRPQDGASKKAKIFRLAVFADAALLNHLSELSAEDPPTAAHAFISTGISAVESLLHEALESKNALKIILVYIGVWSQKTAEPIKREGVAGLNLRNFCEWANKINPPMGSTGHWHHAMFLTGYVNC